MTDEPQTILAGTLRATTTGLLVLVTIIAFEAMAVTTALPTAARELHGLASFGWAYTAFLVANVVAMVASGRLCDNRGAATPLVIGLGAFLGGLVLAGTATTMVQLVAGRAVQGLGGGLMLTALYVVIGQAYSDRLRPTLFAAISSAWVMPSLVGPVVSGLLTQHASWRFVFLGLVPFALAGGVLVLPALRALERPQSARRSTGQQHLVRALGVALGIAALEALGQHPSPALGVLGAGGLTVVGWGLRGLLPAGTFSVRPGVAAPVALRGLLAGAFFGVESVIPLSLTLQHHYTATAAGLPLAGSGLAWAVGSWWQGRSVADDGTQRRVLLIRTGFACIAVAAAGVGVTAFAASPGWLVYPAWLLAGLGAGLSMSSVGIVLLRCTTDATRGSDSAALQLADATGSALTTGFAGVLVAAAARGSVGRSWAFLTLDLAMSAVAGLGVVAAVRARPVSASDDARPAEVAANL